MTWLHGLEEPLLMCDVDRFVNKLYQPSIKKLNLVHVNSLWHRYVVDLNRLPGDIDKDSVAGASSPSGIFPHGLHWSQTTQGHKLIKKSISFQLHQKIVKNYYHPFHRQIKSCYEKMRNQEHPKIYQLDAHSMPSVGTSAHKDPKQERTEVVVSDVEGTSCERKYTELVVSAYKKAGFEVATNKPYTGGRITQTYGQPQKGQHCLQVELNRNLYMDEKTKLLKIKEATKVSDMILKALKVIHAELPLLY